MVSVLCLCEYVADPMYLASKSLRHEEHVFAHRTASNRALASILGGLVGTPQCTPDDMVRVISPLVPVSRREKSIMGILI